jgi:hypothetical protein
MEQKLRILRMKGKKEMIAIQLGPVGKATEESFELSV